jgi:hypothetical protein
VPDWDVVMDRHQPSRVAAVRMWLMARQKASSPVRTPTDCWIKSLDRMVITTVTKEMV